MKKRLICLLGASALLSLPAYAEDTTPPPFDRFVLRIGGNYVFNARTQISANRTNGILGTTVNTEKDLGTNNAAWVARADADWRFARNHTLELGYYTFSLDGSRVINRDFTFRDTTFSVGDQVNTETKWGSWRAEYLYSFYRSNKVDLAFGGGAYGVRVDATINALNAAKTQSADVLAPLPVLGARMDYRVTPKFDVRAAADIFFINQGDYSGSMTDLRLQLEHRTFKHVGFGVGFDHFALNADATGSEWQGTVSADWNSALVYAAFRY